MYCQIDGEDFSNFCALLRKRELSFLFKVVCRAFPKTIGPISTNINFPPKSYFDHFRYDSDIQELYGTKKRNNSSHLKIMSNIDLKGVDKLDG